MADPRKGMDSEHDELTKAMFWHVVKGEWQEVVTIFKQNPEAQDAKITRLGDTVLHIAVSQGNFDVVPQLVELIPEKNVNKVLRAKNERGNTPLHLAATLDTVAMCKCIADKDSKLIGATNDDGETPLFSAVRHGKTKAFLFLHEHSPADAIAGSSYCRRSNGDNILHAAIFGEYFSLANQIIDLYKDLVNKRNEKGQVPLHVLATKPSAFESGSRLGIYDKIVYNCVFVDPLPLETHDKEDYKDDSVDPLPVETHDKEDYKDDPEDKRNSKYPYIYRICLTFFGLLMIIIKVIGNLFRLPMNTIKVLVRGAKNNGNPPDVENPNKASHDGSQGGSGPIRVQFHEGESSNATQIGSAESEFLDIPVETLDKDDYKDDSKDKRSSKYPAHEGESSNATENRSSEPAKDPNLKPQRSGPVSPNYEILFSFFKLVMKGLLIVLGLGLTRTQKIKDKKEKHTWAIYIMDKLLEHTSVWEFDAGGKPHQLPEQTFDETMPFEATSEEDASTNTKGSDTTTRNNNQATDIKVIRDKLECLVKMLAVDNTARKEEGKGETPILLAAKYGVVEMVDKILKKFPVAIRDSDSDKKNVVLLAVENRQPDIYMLLKEWPFQKESVFSELDNQGNSALHLVATLGKHKPRRTPGAAFQMQWELKWYKFVKDSMPRHCFVHYNTNGVTPKEVFNETHKDLVKDGGQWLTNTSQSCSVVAALIATVAFATSSAVPGGVKQDGTPTLEGQPSFNVFAISSLLALCFSVTSLIMFLAILTSRYQAKDFARDLPKKLILGLSFLFISIAAILVSFCSGHFFVVKDNLKYAAYPVYAVTCLPVTFFAAVQFPLYIDLINSTFNKVPQLTSR